MMRTPEGYVCDDCSADEARPDRYIHNYKHCCLCAKQLCKTHETHQGWADDNSLALVFYYCKSCWDKGDFYRKIKEVCDATVMDAEKQWHDACKKVTP